MVAAEPGYSEIGHPRVSNRELMKIRRRERRRIRRWKRAGLTAAEIRERKLGHLLEGR